MTHKKEIGIKDLILQHEIEQYYYREATLLDDRDHSSWFELLHEDIRYFMPIRTNRIQREGALEYTRDDEYAHFDDTYDMLRGRIRKLQADVGWSENPASRTRHIIGNVVLNSVSDLGILNVSSSFILYRNRLERQVDIFAGYRQDELIPVNEDVHYKIRNRTIYIDQSTILSNNLSIFF
ncbi:aromatic-ring-hydroxylating dioxygenase subunit beta [Sphingorhabdus sp. YGSMI21]|uniref:aromatic-ring-hydroxylating dioxygenase subunit beta n=1 Tax=Sphingorhabdus sp. YGSMI21 TaxID=2077182 RepID=UPI000C1F6EDA|nr:aromatic-ring-hydroxylating dioxygenase subunit beta [Sphingorhabdus sp. YGSMI21]ATW05272.1 benzene 1,2-dioxygenase [Sphingorhabdus sp. YGSMI21]